MATWFSSTNYAANLASSAISTGGTATASGYASTALVDGGPGLPWRSGASISSLVLAFDLGSTQSINLVAACNVTAETAPTVFDEMTVYSSTAAPSEFGGVAAWTLRANGTPNDLADCLLDVRSLGFAINARYWKIVLDFDAASVVRVGEIWIGNLVALAKGPQSLSRSSTYPAIVNESDVGNVYAARIGQLRRSWDLTFPPLKTASSANIDAIFATSKGAASPMLYVPNSADLGTFAHGRIADSQQFSTDLSGLEFQRRIVFSESGRGI